MKALYALSFTCLLFPALLHAQTWEITGGVDYLDFQKSTETNTFSGYSYKPIYTPTDTLYQRIYSTSTSQIARAFSRPMGFSIGLRAKWALGAKWKFASGLELARFRFSRSATYSSGGLTIIKIDTVASRPTFSGFNPCDQYTNSPSDLGDIDYTPYYTVYELKIPLEIRRVFFQNRVDVGLGGFLAMPVYTNFYQEFIGTTSQTDASGKVLCTYVKRTDSTNAVPEIARMSMGLRFDVNYYVGKWSAGLGVDVRATNFFEKQDNGFGSISGMESRPIALTARIGYTLSSPATTSRGLGK